MNKQSKKVELCVILYAALENNSAYLLRTEITKSHLNNCICRHCSVKKSTVTPSFYYVFNISLSGNVNIPSFIGNLWWVLLLGIHLKTDMRTTFIHNSRKKKTTQNNKKENYMYMFWILRFYSKRKKNNTLQERSRKMCGNLFTLNHVNK